MRVPPLFLRTSLGSRRRARLHRIDCARCGTSIWICHRCYRGHKYCGHDCAREARRESWREASHCYRNTETGRANGVECSARYRKRQREAAYEGEAACEGEAAYESEAADEGVTQQSLPKSPEPSKISTSPPIGCCAACAAPGRRVDLRRIRTGHARRAGPWKKRRRKRAEFLSWSTIS
jgi:hypothetical protein